MTNNRILEKIGLMINAYNPAPKIAAPTAMLPPIDWIIKLRYAINLNSLFLNRSALGTIFADAKNKLMDNNWHIVSNISCL